VASPATTINIASGSLTAPTGLLASTGNDLNINGIGAYTTQRPADRLAFRADTGTTSNVTSGTVYYSFLLRVDALTGANNVGGDYFVSLNNTANAATTADPTVHPGEMRARVDPTDSSKFSLGMFTQHASVTQNDPAWVNGLNQGDTLFVVGAFNLGGSNTARLWINPSSDFYGAATAPTPTAQDTVSGTNGTTIGSILLHQRTAPWLTMDELRVATTWGEVTPAVLLPVANGLFWDIDGATSGAGGTTPGGTWDGATSNWSTAHYGDAAAQLWTADKVAVFSAGNDASGAYTITVSGTQSASGLTFQDGTATLSGGQVDLTGAGDRRCRLESDRNDQLGCWRLVGLTKTGLGTVVLGGSNTYTGGTTINAGMVHLLTTTAMPATGTVTVNSGTTLSVRAGGAGEWTDSTNTATGGTLGSLIAGRGGQGLADQVVWKDGSTLGVSTLNAAGGSLTYSGVIGGFHTDTGTTNKVGLFKRGGATKLTLTGNNTFSGPLRIDDDGGIVALAGTNANAGQSFADFGQTVPTVSIGSAGGDNTITDGSRDSGIKILVDNALPTNSVISFGSSIGGNDTPSSLLQLYDGFATIGNLPSGSSFNQTIRGVTGGSGRIKTGLGTLTIDVPYGETYVSGGTMRTDYQDATNHGKIVKTGAGRQDFNQANGNFNGDFVIQNGTLGVGTANVFGVSGSTTNRLILNGGTLMNVGNSSVTISVKRVEFGGSFTVDPVTASNIQFQDATFTLTTANPTITVLPGAGGQFIAWGKITDNGAGYGFTKAGAGYPESHSQRRWRERLQRRHDDSGRCPARH
jgi:autotransporter-associated beta strand protein